MTVSPLGTAPELACAGRVRAALQAPVDTDVPPDVARRALREWAQAEAQIAARKMALIRVVDHADVARSSGSTSTSDLLSGDFGGDRASASRQVRAARNLKVATLTEKALEAGEITFEKAEVIARSMAGLPESLDELTRVRVEKRLIGDAKRLSLPDLRRRVMRVADIYRPRDEADIDEDTLLRRQEARAWQNTELWFGQARDGLVPFGGKVPEAQADMLKNQVGAIAAPRRNETPTPT